MKTQSHTTAVADRPAPKARLRILFRRLGRPALLSLLALTVLLALGGTCWRMHSFFHKKTAASAARDFQRRHELWLADARTFANMVAFLLSPEPPIPMPTNQPLQTNLVVNG